MRYSIIDDSAKTLGCTARTTLVLSSFGRLYSRVQAGGRGCECLMGSLVLWSFGSRVEGSLACIRFRVGCWCIWTSSFLELKQQGAVALRKFGEGFGHAQTNNRRCGVLKLGALCFIVLGILWGLYAYSGPLPSVQGEDIGCSLRHLGLNYP